MSQQDNNKHPMKPPGPDDLDRVLQEFVDGDLSGRRLREFERRLEQDDSLGKELKAYQAVEAGLAEQLDRDVPGVDYEGMREDILAAVERKVIMQGPSHTRTLRWRPMVGVLSAAAVVLVALGVWMAISGPGETGREIEQASVMVEPAAPQQGGGEVASVSLAEPQWDHVVLSPERDYSEDGPGQFPAGTVFLSVGEADENGSAEDYPMVVH